MKKFRCGVIGCGRIGCGFDDHSFGKSPKTHAGSYVKHQETELIALCDVDAQKLKKYGKKFGVKALYTKSLDMFKNEDLDCVSICTLVDSHLNLVNQAAKYGVRGIFVEKPLSNSLKNASEIIRICKQNNIVLAVNHQRRFDPFYHSIKKSIHKKLGNLQSVNAYYGGGITNTGSHLFDILRYFFGDVVWLQSTFSKNSSNNKADPNIDCLIEFKNGIRCSIHALNLKNYGIFELDIFGTKGRLNIDMTSNRVQFYKISSKNSFVYKDLVPSKINVKHSNLSSIFLGVKNLIKATKQKCEPFCTGEDGYQSVQLIIASLLSAEKGIKVKLPVKSKYIIKSK